MKKKLFIIVLLLAATCSARTITGVRNVEGNILHTIQAGWVTVDETVSTDPDPCALAVGERTKLLTEAAIAAAANGDDEISTFVIPANWNGIRFRSVGITDNDAQVYEIYLGTTSSQESNADCALTHAGQLSFTTGTQVSLYYQIAFTSGGSYEPQPGDIFTGNSSDETAVVVSTILSGGSWAAGDAAGTIQYLSKSGTFTNTETVSVGNGKQNKADVLTHAGTDLVGFEMADAVTATAKSWGSTWLSISPADDTNAEAEIDVKGANFLVVLASETSHDCKLLIKGY